MNTEKVIALLSKYEEGTISSEEKALLESWYIQQANQSKHQLSEDAIEKSFNYLKAQLPVKTSKTLKLWPRIAIASAVAFMVIGVYFFRTSFTGQDDRSKYIAADIDPGKNGATLTLANGTKILINDVQAGDIANQSGVKISKTKDGQIIYEITEQSPGKSEYNTLSTTRGEQTQVRLPDGSLVFLNAASSLRYPTSFAKSSQRRVSLTGEGYFEIAKDKTHPFVVVTGKQEVEVLGTHFNINSYNDEAAIKTTLLEGSVKVRLGKMEQVLRPGFQTVANGSEIKVSAADLENAVDWKNNEFLLDNQDLQMSLREIARWYDLEVVYASDVPSKIETGGGISRNSKLTSVLKLIESSGLVHFRLEGKRLYVYK